MKAIGTRFRRRVVVCVQVRVSGAIILFRVRIYRVRLVGSARASDLRLQCSRILPLQCSRLSVVSTFLSWDSECKRYLRFLVDLLDFRVPGYCPVSDSRPQVRWVWLMAHPESPKRNVTRHTEIQKIGELSNRPQSRCRFRMSYTQKSKRYVKYPIDPKVGVDSESEDRNVLAPYNASYKAIRQKCTFRRK